MDVEGESDNDSQTSIASDAPLYTFSNVHPNYAKGADFVDVQATGQFAQILQNAPVLNQKNVRLWTYQFISYLSNFHNLNLMILGKELYPQHVRNYTTRDIRRQVYIRRLEMASKLLQHVILQGVKSDDPKYDLFLQMIRDCGDNKPAKLWNKLSSLLNVQRDSERTLTILKWIDSTNRTDRGAEKELPLDTFTSEHNAKFERMKASGVTLEDIDVILYLRGLPSRYQEVITTFMQKTARFNRDAVFRAARVLDSTKSALQQGGFAYEHARSATDEALYANNGKRKRDKYPKGNGKGKSDSDSSGKAKLTRLFKGKEYEHDVKKHPNGPTPWEKNLTCKNCDIEGHAVRTCHKSTSKPDKTDKDKKPEKKRKRKKAKKEGEKAHLAESYDQDGEWHDEDDSSNHDKDEYCISNNVSTSHATLNDNENGLYLKPYWRAPLGYLAYLLFLLFYTIGEKIFLSTHQLYQKYSSRYEIAFMMQENEDAPPLKKQFVSCFVAATVRTLKFIVDSGASRHMANVEPNFFEKYERHSSDDDIVRVKTAAKTVIQSIGEGSFGPMSNILCIPDLSANLFSVRACCANGYKVLFSADKCEIFNSPDVISFCSPVMSAYPDGKSWVLEVCSNDDDTQDPRDIAFLADTAALNKYERAHNRLPHPSYRTLHHMKQSANWSNFGDWTKQEQRSCSHSICKGCAQGKQHMAPVSRKPRLTPLATAPGELFFMDLFYSNVASDRGRKWCLLFVDAHSRRLWPKFLTNKSETTAKIKEWVADRETEGILLKQWAILPKKRIKSDPGTEFANQILAQFFQEKKITQEITPAKEHCHMVERQIQTVKEGAASYLQAAKVELTRAAHAVDTREGTLGKPLQKPPKPNLRKVIFL